MGDFELNVAFRFGGIPLDIAERSLKLFAKEVLPVLKGCVMSSVNTSYGFHILCA